MEPNGENPRLETAIGQFEFEVLIFGQKFFDAVVEELFGPNQQDFVPLFLFQLTQRHSVFFEEADKLFARNATILATGKAISLQEARIEPFGNHPWGGVANFGHLTGGEHLPRQFHSSSLSESLLSL
jgi:hypothetical protein